jgi:hypothetical protein
MTSHWIVFPKANPKAKIRLVCFPCAGRGASLYRTWPGPLGKDVEVCAIQLPGRENRLDEPPRQQGPVAADGQPTSEADYTRVLIPWQERLNTAQHLIPEVAKIFMIGPLQLRKTSL